MKSVKIPYKIAVVLLMLLNTTAIQAQLTTGGDVAGGYLWISPHQLDDHLKHLEGHANLWLGYKADTYDWRLSLNGQYKDVEGEREIYEVDAKISDKPVFTFTFTGTNDKPFDLTARYDLNWRRPDKSAYTLWTSYGYGHTQYDNASWNVVLPLSADFVSGTHGIQDKKDISHKLSVGYSGTTRLNSSRWVLKSSADVSLQKRKVEDDWLQNDELVDFSDNSQSGTWQGMMEPDYTDYAVHAALGLTDTISNRRTSRLVLNGGLRFLGEGERFLQELNVVAALVDPIAIEQEATGFRFFVEPFLGAVWRSGKWSVNAEYGLRLYHAGTSDKTGHAIQVYNFIDMGADPISDTNFSHFTPLMNGSAKLSYAFSKHHSLSFTNSISNRLPTNQQSIICFVQTNELNNIFLGNPYLKPEVRMQFSLDHTLTYGPFSATTSVSAERTNNLMEFYLFRCKVGSRALIARIMQNDADASIYRLSETLAWNNKWLKANATIWRHWAHYQGIGNIRGGREVDDKNWGWNLNARADLGRGWVVAANFRFMGGVKTVALQSKRMWQSSTVSVEKRISPVTLYLNASRLIDPAHQIRRYDADGNEIYNSISRMNNRIVMIGCRWQK
jgi:hypothetical protein